MCNVFDCHITSILEVVDDLLLFSVGARHGLVIAEGLTWTSLEQIHSIFMKIAVSAPVTLKMISFLTLQKVV